MIIEGESILPSIYKVKEDEDRVFEQLPTNKKSTALKIIRVVLIHYVRLFINQMLIQFFILFR